MNISKTGPVILVEDNPHDLDVIVAALIENGVKNQIKFFDNAASALQYLQETSDQPFIILCDIRMKGMNGLEFRNTINANDFLRKKAIPFVFLTGAVSQGIVDEAYDLTVQGFIEKPMHFNELKTVLGKIFDYWQCCLHPNSF